MTQLIIGDCREVMAGMAEASVDAIVTDPPYELNFMGKAWDRTGVAFQRETWALALRLLKPGGHLLAMGGTRTYHRMACAIEDAGFEVRDCVQWLYGSGFPKSHNISKAIDARGGESVAWFGPWFRVWRESRGIMQKQVSALFPSKTGGLTGCVANWELGLNLPTPDQFNLIRDTFGLPFDSIEAAKREVIGSSTKSRSTSGKFALPTCGGETVTETWNVTAPATDMAREWQGWGTALKPACELICLARKPLSESTVAANVLAHGTGALNVDGCRVATADDLNGGAYSARGTHRDDGWGMQRGQAGEYRQPEGRWPANVIHDGSEEVDAAFAEFGPVSRFFYCSKASKKDRDDGLDCLEIVSIVGSWANVDLQVKLLVDTARLAPRVIAAFDVPFKDVSEWNTLLFGSDTTDQFLTECRSTIRTRTNSITELETLSCLARLSISGFTVDVSGVTANGGNPVGSADNSIQSIVIISDGTASLPGVGLVPSKTQLRISASAGRNLHSTVKPTALMRYLCRLITPPDGTVLDPFMGTGSTGRGAVLEGFDFIGIEMDPQWVDIAQKRIQAVMQGGGTIDTSDHRERDRGPHGSQSLETPQACGPGGSEELT